LQRALVANRHAQQGGQIRRVDPERAPCVGETDIAFAQNRAARTPVAQFQVRARRRVRIAEHALLAVGRDQHQMPNLNPFEQR
jgi:hypothetical protein